MNKIIKTGLLFIMVCAFTSAKASHPDSTKPKLIVGIVIDQMRYDYITRYWSKFGNEGFKKLIREGYSFTNTHYNYVPTETGPGHASIYTGTTPEVHGMIANNWYHRNANQILNVVSDSTVTGVGTTTIAGKKSPVHLIPTTIGDELKIASNLRSKIIGVAIKDRGAILPAGHTGNAAYWFEVTSGNWITSSFYMSKLPEWVDEFNKKKIPAQLINEPWKTLYPIETYTESTADNTRYEAPYPGNAAPVFPHIFNISGSNFESVINNSPAGDLLTKEFALTAMRNENLGKDEFTDLLAVSFSSPDNVGHQFGTHAVETEDIYLRLDLQLADFIKQIEAYTGKENVLFFLTADHAVIPNVMFLRDQRIPAGIFNIAGIRTTLRQHIDKIFGVQPWITQIHNDQIYLNHDVLREQKMDIKKISDEIITYLMNIPGVAEVVTKDDLRRNEYTRGIKAAVQKGFHTKRSGDLVIILEPGLVEYATTGTDHSTAYTYDTHVPLIFYGAGIKNGTTARYINITDIAPTLSNVLGIQPPSGCNGNVLIEIVNP